jgi:hypothetical protein
VRLVLAVVLLVVLAGLAVLWAVGSGRVGRPPGPGTPTATPIPDEVVAARATAQRQAAAGVAVREAKQVLFGDLHAHTTYSVDAFLVSLPMAQGQGAHPVGDACDFARYCAGLDFWSINDHAGGLTPPRWRETVEAIRQCNAVADNPASPDTVAFLGWEWTQMGTTPQNHYGHRNVILADTEEGRIPARPIGALLPIAAFPPPPTLVLGMLPFVRRNLGYVDVIRYVVPIRDVPACAPGVPVRDLPDDCRETVSTPGELFAKLEEWGHRSMVIPHGTTWGFYTPAGSSWDKQIGAQHDPDRQPLIEIFSGHGNSEEYRSWTAATLARDGRASCPEPSPDYLPSCWRAGEIIEERCREAGESAPVCAERAAEARHNYLAAGVSGHYTVPGASPEDWLDAGQCRDCTLPAFNYRPQSSVQYIMALRRPDPSGAPERFRFGFLASSDNHSARPGTGYKEYDRPEQTESRFDRLADSIMGGHPDPDPVPRSVAFDPVASGIPFFGLRESERSASFFLTGGLVALHAEGRSREAIWSALESKEVYGTSGPRILLWFDLVNAPGGRRQPMGSTLRMAEDPLFEVRAVGSFEQLPGCPDYSVSTLAPERLERLCRGECYHPSEQRRRITRIEVVRIRPQTDPSEPIGPLVEDPWRVFPCPPDPSGCTIGFSDPAFAAGGRDALYYVRAIEEPSLVVNAGMLRCEYDAAGRCVRMAPCGREPYTEDCLGESEERAWSSPIFVDFRDAAGPDRSPVDVSGSVAAQRR